MSIYIIKANGEKAAFSPDKIYHTAIRAGASPGFADEVVSKVRKKVRNGMSTRAILKLTLFYLKENPVVAERYTLKQAIMNLGPHGYFFERFFARLLENHGYKTRVGKVMQGKCVTQEVDISAVNKLRYMIECKYHNSPGIYTDIKEAMYTYARFLDLKKHFDRAWLATNTKMSHHAKQYCNCMEIKITSWNYPHEENLQTLIMKKNLYPITILRALSRFEREKLSRTGILLVKDITSLKVGELMSKASIPRKKAEKILLSARQIV
ncbi:MAG: ATP cone domain-containing protein [archaeon]